MKKIIILITIIFLLTGCINYTELDKIAVVKTLYIDYTEDNYIVKCSTISKDENDKKIDYIESSGKTIKDALNDVYLKSNKKLYLSHIELLVVTENLINNKTEELINFFLKTDESRNNFNLALLDEEQLIDDDDNINDFIEIVEKETGTVKSINLESFIKDILKYNQTYLPMIHTENNEIVINKIKLIEDYGIFDELSSDETIIYNLVYNNINKANINDIDITSNTTIIHTKKNKILINITSNVDKNKEEYQSMVEKGIIDLFEKYKSKGFNIFRFDTSIYGLNDLELEIRVKGIDNNDNK